MADKAVVLARGAGTRMRAADARARLTPEQDAAAAAGLKGMIPFGRPFLDYALSALADAGFAEACLVVGPEHAHVRSYYERLRPTRIRVRFAQQPDALGTADAVLAAEQFAGDEPFVVLNSDNYYPPAVLARLRATEPPAIVGFDREALVLEGNVPPDRVARFGALEVGPDGFLVRIAADESRARASTGDRIYASMNCWLFTREIFGACRSVPPSARGEFELTQAVQLAIDELGMRFRVVYASVPVLDLSTRGDIATVAERVGVIGVDL